MSGRPRPFDGEVGGDSGDVPNLKPSEDNVKFRCIADEAEPTSNLFGASKASEEQKKIAASDFVPREMTLRGRGLAEDRTPSRGARDRIAAQIRIEMRAITLLYSTARQVFDNPRNR